MSSSKQITMHWRRTVCFYSAHTNTKYFFPFFFFFCWWSRSPTNALFPLSMKRQVSPTMEINHIEGRLGLLNQFWVTLQCTLTQGHPATRITCISIGSVTRRHLVRSTWINGSCWVLDCCVMLGKLDTRLCFYRSLNTETPEDTAQHLATVLQ